jgi:hypothetical protein
MRVTKNLTRMLKPAIFFDRCSPIVIQIEIKSSKENKRKKRRVKEACGRWNPWFLGINRAVVTDTSLMLRDSLVMPDNRFVARASPLLIIRGP